MRGWNPPILGSDAYELTWFGHHQGATHTGKIRLQVGPAERGKLDTRPAFYLTIVDADKNPQVELTTDEDEACTWSISSEKAKSYTDKIDNEYYEEHTAGYIRTVDVADGKLFLKLASGPPLHARTLVTDGHRRYPFEYQVFSVSKKKECMFHYARGWTETN